MGVLDKKLGIGKIKFARLTLLTNVKFGSIKSNLSAITPTHSLYA
jgi:hypothetical protein